MEQNILKMAMGALLATASVASGQNPYGIELNPGERLVSVDGVAVNSNAPATGAVERVQDVASHATNIVGNLVQSGRAFSHSAGETALEKANTERARNGQRSLLPDPALQQLALHKATIAAQRSYKNHVGGSLGGAACEGVGFTNGRFLTCCLDKPGTYGGAAMVQGRDGWYCCLLVR